MIAEIAASVICAASGVSLDHRSFALVHESTRYVLYMPGVYHNVPICK